MMNKRNLLLCGLVGLSCLIIISACKKLDDLDDLDVVNYDAEFAIPLFSGNASFQDVLENFDEETFITILPDGLIQLNYKGDVTARSSADLFEVLDVAGFPLEDTLNGVGFDLPSNVDVDFAILKNGTVSWYCESKHDEPVDVTLTIPNAIKDGVPFMRETTIGPDGFWAQLPIDIAGYTLTPTNDSVFVEYKAYRENSVVSDTLTNFLIVFQDFEASYIEGYLGNDLYDLPRDTIEIEIFENWTRGDLYFEEPTILVGVENSFGFPVRTETEILSIITVDGDSIGLESTFIDEGNGIDFNYPTLDEVGEVKTTEFYFDNSNSNIAEIIGEGPVFVDYDIDAIPNPDQDTAIRGFMTDSSYLRVQVEVNMPIYGTAVGFEARDTFPIDFGEYDNVDYVEFKLISDNGIPVEVGMQAYFADASGNILDSLFTPAQVILDGAPVDGDGLVTNTLEKITYSTLESERFQNIKLAKSIFIRASFSTTNNGMDAVKISLIRLLTLEWV